jgi:hypothetical protein
MPVQYPAGGLPETVSFSRRTGIPAAMAFRHLLNSAMEFLRPGHAAHPVPGAYIPLLALQPRVSGPGPGGTR